MKLSLIPTISQTVLRGGRAAGVTVGTACCARRSSPAAACLAADRQALTRGAAGKEKDTAFQRQPEAGDDGVVRASRPKAATVAVRLASSTANSVAAVLLLPDWELYGALAPRLCRYPAHPLPRQSRRRGGAAPPLPDQRAC